MGEWFEDESFWSELYPFMFPEERFRHAEEQIEKVLALVGYKEGAVLDLCCGPGRRSLALAKHGIQVTAVDRSEFLLRKAKPPSTRNWAVTIRVEKVKEGKFSEPKFTFTVHSPARAGLEVGGRCAIEAIWTEQGYIVDDTRWMRRNRARR
jgi:tRNA/tmRNA/rRNA uracil-C5-methylase (TrmA/RlmC/RlmD family)